MNVNLPIKVTVYFSAPLQKTAAKLGFKLPTATDFPWQTLVKSSFGEFGVDGTSGGYAFLLQANRASLDSVIPELIDRLQKATPRTLRLVVEYDTSDRAMAKLVEPWRQRLFDCGFEVL
jgi:hypothetical protein